MSEPRRLLFISQVLAMPDQHGGCVYPHALLNELHRQGVAIDYIWLGNPLAGGRRIMRDPLVAPFIASSRVRGTRKLGRFLVPETLARLLRPLSDPAETAINGREHLPIPAEQTFAAHIIRRLAPSAVLIDGTCNLPVLDSLAPTERARLRVGVLTHNLQSRRTDLYRAHGRALDFLAMTLEEEKALLARADQVIAIQEREAEAFRTMLPRSEVLTVPMPVLARPQAPERAIPGRCLFVGGYSGHNIEAVQWLLRDIWPRVRSAVPTAELTIAGTVCQAAKSLTAGVRLLGALNDLREIYAEASLSLVPLPLGTGLKIKLVEAMGFGRPVVTTSAGAEGFTELETGKVAVLADDTEGFAAAVVQLLQSESLRREISERQLAWIKTKLAPAAAVSPLDTLWRRA